MSLRINKEWAVAAVKKANKLIAIFHNRTFTFSRRLHLQFLSQDEVVISSLFETMTFFPY